VTTNPLAPAGPAPESPSEFYARVLTEAERADLPLALKLQGVDEEIALLRLRLRSALLERSDDLALIFKGIDLLAKAVAARYRLPKAAEDELAETLQRLTASIGGLWLEEPPDA
jgi:hypothetical protein